jgi:amidase
MASASLPDSSRSAGALASALRNGEISATALARDHLTRLERVRSYFGAVAALQPDRTLADAAASDARLRAGTARPLEGVPITVKDWIDVEGWPVAGSAAVHRDRRPERDATAVARLRAAGAVVTAITTALADSSAHGRTANPRDPTRAPGGSSSGAAAVVAAGASPLALGSDSGGSIRLPAAWCGVCGLKPSFGRVPLTGHFPRLGSLSDARTVIGPLATYVADLALALRLIAGPDGLDGGTVPVPLEDPDQVPVSRLRIGTMRGGDSDAVTTALAAVRASGATIDDGPLPDVRDEALEITRRYWNRAQLDGRANDQLLWDWDRFQRRLLRCMAPIDALLVPATTEPAPSWRESIETDYVWQLPWSLTGAPAVVLPVTSEQGLPVAVQVVAPRWNDHVALAVAQCVEGRGDNAGS